MLEVCTAIWTDLEIHNCWVKKGRTTITLIRYYHLCKLKHTHKTILFFQSTYISKYINRTHFIGGHWGTQVGRSNQGLKENKLTPDRALHEVMMKAGHDLKDVTNLNFGIWGQILKIKYNMVLFV